MDQGQPSEGHPTLPNPLTVSHHLVFREPVFPQPLYESRSPLLGHGESSPFELAKFVLAFK
ncbi:hypothetical protein DEO72_LG11g2937 [Vigna unguiculata]|uniref:Uncharacterized protein n=1 Tax=Vigna unguiculata TaxID=3917 RepID=A0A4D6NTE7_VIGUN|nr:hypothetical protein DEO72_LG11g2937 [Vigna unguiculata]